MSGKTRTKVGFRSGSAAVAPRGGSSAAVRRTGTKVVVHSPAAPSAHASLDVAAIRRNFGISRAAFARLTGYSERALANWEAQKQAPDVPTTRRLRELERLRKALCTVINEEGLGAWLEVPNAAFEGFKPLEVIERGETDRLWRMVFELESGAFT